MATNCGRQNNSPKDVHILIHRACDCITVHGRRDFVDVVKSRTLRWGDYPGSFECAQFIHWRSHKRGRKVRFRGGDVKAEPGVGVMCGLEQGMQSASGNGKRQ